MAKKIRQLSMNTSAHVTPFSTCAKATVDQNSFTAVYLSCLLYFIGASLKHMFEKSLKLSRRIAKWFGKFQVLKLFSVLFLGFLASILHLRQILNFRDNRCMRLPGLRKTAVNQHHGSQVYNMS